jgi:hypothetical protein
MLPTLPNSLTSDDVIEAGHYAKMAALTFEYMQEKMADDKLSKRELVQLTIAASNFALSNSTIQHTEVMRSVLSDLNDISGSLCSIASAIENADRTLEVSVEPANLERIIKAINAVTKVKK